MNRRRFLQFGGIGFAGLLPGCNGILGGDSSGRQRTTPTPTTGQTVVPVHRSFGEGFRTSFGQTVTVRRPDVQKQFAWTGFDVFVTAATGQFLVVPIAVEPADTRAAARPPDGASYRAALVNSPSGQSGKLVSGSAASHPEPTPLPFRPDIRAMLDGTTHAPTRIQAGWRNGVEVLFEVPARPVTDGLIEWRSPDGPVQWALPDQLLADLPASPAFDRQSLSLSGWPWSDDGLHIGGTVENSAPHGGVYRIVVTIPNLGLGHNAWLFETPVAGGERTSLDWTLRLQRDAADDSIEVIVLDGYSRVRRTVTYGE